LAANWPAEVPLPLPPPHQAQGLRLLRIAAGRQWIRIHRCHHPSALHWGRQGQGRWNAPDAAFGVLYVADDLETAFAETFGHQVMASHLPAAVKFLSRQELEERCIARITARRDLQVLDLRGPALARLNLDAQLLSSREQLSVCQAWSRWWHDAAEQPDGLLYPSRLLPRGTNLALYERCADAWQEEHLGDLMHWPATTPEPAVLEILDAHGWGLVG
jgi:RES domain-containing protein